jgi:hypothetical protein
LEPEPEQLLDNDIVSVLTENDNQSQVAAESGGGAASAPPASPAASFRSEDSGRKRKANVEYLASQFDDISEDVLEEALRQKKKAHRLSLSAVLEDSAEEDKESGSGNNMDDS